MRKLQRIINFVNLKLSFNRFSERLGKKFLYVIKALCTRENGFLEMLLSIINHPFPGYNQNLQANTFYYKKNQVDIFFKSLCYASKNLMQISWITTFRRHVCMSGAKKRLFFGKFGVLWFFVTLVLRFVLLPYYRQFFEQLQCNTKETLTQIFSLYCCWKANSFKYADTLLR